MRTFTESFRTWWRPPRRVIDRERDRRVTFLELFYDLVYVVLVAEISHALAGHVNRQGVLEFVFLFVLVWVAWVNGTLYHDLHGNNDIRTRVFTFAQMFTVAAMAVFAHNAFGEGATGFALAFAAYQLILTYLWWRSGVHDPVHRPLSRPYSLLYLISALLFLFSAFLPESWRIYLWLTALLLSVSGPLITSIIAPDDPDVQAEQARSMTATHSVVERFGLFIIIVLGEVIVGVVRGVAEHHHLNWIVFITAGFGMLIAIGLWWLYFDFVSHRLPKEGRWWMTSWSYLHFFVALGIVATGAAILNVVEHAGEAPTSEVTWLLTGALALALVAIALLMGTIRLADEHRSLYRWAALATVLSALLCVLLGAIGLPTLVLLILLNLLLLLPVAYGLIVWIQVLGAEEIVIE